jgi:excisionase family DNA binding protein
MNANSKYLNTKQAAEFLGRSPGAIRNLVARRNIPYRKPGGRLVFILSELEQWIDISEGLNIEKFKESA